MRDTSPSANTERLRARFLALQQATLQLVQETSLERLLARITAIAREQVGARYAALGVLDENGRLKQFIPAGMSPEEIKNIPHPPRGKGLIGALMAGEGPIRLAEIARDSRHVGFPRGHPIMHSFLGVPIRLAGKQLGQIYLTDKQDGGEFSDEDETMVEMLAGYAAVAIHNARLYETLRAREKVLTRRNQDLALLNQVGVTLASSLELDEVLQRTLSLLMEYFRMEAGEIFLYEEESQSLRLVLHRGEAAQAFWTRTRFRLGEGIIGLTAQMLQSIVSDDLRREAQFVREAVVQAGFRQMVCVPLTARDRLKGVLSMIGRKRKRFDKDHIRLLESVAGWAGMAIENAQLHYNARRVAILEERERIGMDLHDGIVQSIYGVGLMLEEARQSVREKPAQVEARLQKAIEDLNLILRDIRNYILDLRPHQLREADLLAGLRRLMTEFQQNTPVEITFNSPGNDSLTGLPRAHALALFHICQEALANIAKHAQASNVNVVLWAAADRVLLEIQDNGKGFDMEAVRRTVGHGLANMLTRAQRVGGDVEVISAPGEGTTILAWVPRRGVE
jgi:signal transduction histidine kinase